MHDKTTQQPTQTATEPSIYEQMNRYLYAYHFGRITFLELLEKWKEVLQLPSGDNK
jgi:hypothetical protein